jgi:hypothetical protein
MLAVVPVLTFGSGSYAGRPPKPPEHIDSAKYELGKNLITGRLTPSSQSADRKAQSARLKELQDQLSKRVQATVNLPALSGKLSPEQLDGLEYYLLIRYKVK